ncbi:heparinase II/III domain-containing protein [Maritalea sp.]|uniref:heparinase II/III domain-containing protein n=1 Tax=Maritalea sp. TaxID=2003361 RepID=UPI003EF5518B
MISVLRKYFSRKNPVEELRENLKRRPLAPYDELDTSPKHLSSNFQSTLDDLIELGWFRQGDHLPSLAPPLPWTEFDRSFAFQLNAWEPLTFLLKGACTVDDPVRRRRYFDVSYAFALDWIQRFQIGVFDGPPALVLTDESRAKEGFAWYDMAVGQRLYRMAYILDVIARDDDYSDEEVELFFKSVVFHNELLLAEGFFKHQNNHGIYQALGQIAAAKRFSHVDPRFDEYFRIATNRLWRCLDSHFTPDNVHKEHSPGYHYMILGSLIGALQTELIEDREIAQRISEMEQALAWMIQPDYGLITFGDSDPRLMLQKSVRLASRYDNDALQYVMSGGQAGRPAKGGVQAYLDAGYAFARLYPDSQEPVFEDASYRAQMAAFHSRTHKHADHVSFLWYDRHREILIDPGRYAYAGRTERGSDLFKEGFWYSDPKRIYVESTRSHNCVEIDGKSYPRGRPGGQAAKPFGSALVGAEQQSGLAVTQCEVSHFKFVRHWRSLILNPGKFLVVLDWLYDRSPDVKHDFRQWFQFHPDWEVKKNDGIFRARSAETDQRREENMVVTSLLPEPLISEVIWAQEEPQLQGWMSDAANSFVPTSSFNLALENTDMARFATIFSFGKQIEVDHGRSNVNRTMRSGRFVWTDDRGTHRLKFSGPLGEVLKVELS